MLFAALLALPSSRRDALHHGLVEHERGKVHRHEVHQHQSLERDAAMSSSGATSIPTNAFLDSNNNLREPSILVRNQKAECPDAQCPRAKMENIGYMAKGYNILKGNPYSTIPGVDPGFTDRAGGLIWDIGYGLGQETADGRYQVPDFTIIEHNEGCSLAMTTTTSSNEAALEESYSNKVSVSAEASSGLYSGQFSANTEWSGFSSSQSSEMTTDITSSADCVVYHTKIPKFSEKPKFTENFLAGVASLIHMKPTDESEAPADLEAEAEGDLQNLERPTDGVSSAGASYETALKPFYTFFDEFGTHWQEYTKMGARFGLTTKIKEKELEELEKGGLTVDVSASIAWVQKAECPNDPCKEKEGPALKRTNGRKPSKVSDDDDDWKGDDAEDLEKSEPMVERSRVLHEQKVLRYKSTSPSSSPRHVYSEPMGWESRWVPEDEPRVTARRLSSVSVGSVADDFSQTDMERSAGQVSASGGAESNKMQAEKMKSKSESMKMISFGAKPRGDVLEWAEQTEDENMPIIYQLSDVCELVKLAMVRDFVSSEKRYCNVLNTHKKCGGRCLSKAKVCPTEQARLPPCELSRAGQKCTVGPETNDKCGTEDLENCGSKSVYYNVPRRHQLKQSEIEADINGIITTVTDEQIENVYTACKEAQMSKNYCEYVKDAEQIATMTCKPPEGKLVERPVFECTSHYECEGKKTPMHNKCVNNKCVMQYKRIVDVAMVSAEDRNNNHCSDPSLSRVERGGQGTYEVVEVEGDVSGWDNEFKDQIRGKTSEMQIRLCVKYSEAAVTEDLNTRGVCQMMLAYGESCGREEAGLSFTPVTRGAESDGNFKQEETGPALWLCMSYQGCEGRSGDAGGKRALTKLGLVRNEGTCPKSMPSGSKVWQVGGGFNGDLNKDMNTGGDVYLCQQNEKAF